MTTSFTTSGHSTHPAAHTGYPSHVVLCPQCNGLVKRIRRRPIDRIISVEAMYETGRALLLGSLFLLSMAFAQGASAFPIPIPDGTTPVEDLDFDFDFSMSTPPPPYDAVQIDITLIGGSPADTLTIDVFAAENGTGGIVATENVDPSVPAEGEYLPGLPDLNDGMFSVGLRLDAGTADLTSITATAFTAAGQSVTISGVLAVPEPATLALLGVALAGLGLARRY